jgi:hypothetical protein
MPVLLLLLLLLLLLCYHTSGHMEGRTIIMPPTPGVQKRAKQSMWRILYAFVKRLFSHLGRWLSRSQPGCSVINAQLAARWWFSRGALQQRQSI